MISSEHLRREIDETLFYEIKECQPHLSRFEVSVCFELSLVSVRFAFMSSSFEEYKFLVRRGLKTKYYKGHAGSWESSKAAKEEVADKNHEEDFLITSYTRGNLVKNNL